MKLLQKKFAFLNFQNILDFDKLKDFKGSKQKELNNQKDFSTQMITKYINQLNYETSKTDMAFNI